VEEMISNDEELRRWEEERRDRSDIRVVSPHQIRIMKPIRNLASKTPFPYLLDVNGM